jgi:hypothetical protein
VAVGAFWCDSATPSSIVDRIETPERAAQAEPDVDGFDCPQLLNDPFV